MEVTASGGLSVLFLTIARNQASYRYRVAQFMPFWSEYGIRAHEICVVGKSYFSKLRIALSARRYDYVILQKKLLSALPVSLIARRCRLVYDFDDALYAQEPYVTGRPKPTQPGSTLTAARLRRVLTHAHMVFAGSSTLGHYASRFASRVHVVPTALQDPGPARVPEAAAGVLRVGWIGNAGNLFYLAHQDPVFARLQEHDPRIRFCCMSSEPPRETRTQWAFSEWSSAAEQQWLASMDVGIMPLTNDPWSEGKCAFKLLQFMSHGCAVVGSAVGANRDVIAHGENGFLAGSNQEWHDALRRLADEPELVRCMGQVSRQRFMDGYERSGVQRRIADLLLSGR